MFWAGILWIGATILGGYSLGRLIPNIGQYIHYVIAIVVFISILPPIIGILRSRKTLRDASGSPVDWRQGQLTHAVR